MSDKIEQDQSREKPPPAAGTPVQRANGETVQMVSAYIPVPLAVKLREFCFKYNRKITDVVSQALEEHFRK